MTIKTTPFDASEYLEPIEDINIFPQDAAEDNNPEAFLHALT
jgi:DNA-binding phage protein